MKSKDHGVIVTQNLDVFTLDRNGRVTQIVRVDLPKIVCYPIIECRRIKTKYEVLPICNLFYGRLRNKIQPITEYL